MPRQTNIPFTIVPGPERVLWALLRNKNKWEFHYFFKVSLKFHRHQCRRSIIASVMYKVSLKGVSLRLPRPRNMPSHGVPIVQIFLSLAATMLHKLLIGNHGQFIQVYLSRCIVEFLKILDKVSVIQRFKWQFVMSNPSLRLGLQTNQSGWTGRVRWLEKL